MLKSDQENASLDLVGEANKKRSSRIWGLYSKVYDSQSNGTAERAVQQIECIVRTHKFALEQKLKRKLPSKQLIMTRLVEHGADVLNKYLVGKDGRTAYERVKGKTYSGEMYEFGRKIYHMSPGKHSGGSMEARRCTSTFLGKLPRSDESMVFTEDGKVAKVRSIRLMLDAESWDPEMIEKITTSR